MTVGSGDDAEPALFRILISSDIHLGYGEKDPERANDSFNTFDEILDIGEKQDVDLVLLGGDLEEDVKVIQTSEEESAGQQQTGARVSVTQSSSQESKAINTNNNV